MDPIELTVALPLARTPDLLYLWLIYLPSLTQAGALVSISNWHLSIFGHFQQYSLFSWTCRASLVTVSKQYRTASLRATASLARTVWVFVRDCQSSYRQ